MKNKKINLAIIGCGAITEKLHLPVAVQQSEFYVSTLIDVNEARARQLARQFEIKNVYTDYRRIIDSEVDAVINALPNYLHAPVSRTLLQAGVHVLVEKPLALTTAECKALIKTAESCEVVLAVGLMRRFSYAGRFVKSVVAGGMLGKVLSFDIRDGFVYTWPVSSAAFLSEEKTGGGVLMDLGVHALDQILWWFGEIASIEYFDDSYGGVEAECELRLKMKSGARGILELSRTRDLRNTAIIRGENATLEVSLVENDLQICLSENQLEFGGRVNPSPHQNCQKQRIQELIAAEHQDFIAAIQNGRQPTVNARDGLRAVAVIERCYAKRRPLHLPWVENPTTVDTYMGARE